MSPAKIPSKPSAKPGKDIIYIDADDEITAVIDKVEAAKNKVVALVLPKRTPVLQSIVNMRLLKRATDESGKNVVLITSEAALLPLAGAAKIHVAKNLQSRPEIPDEPVAATEAPAASADEDDEETLRKIDYKRPIGALAAGAAGDDAEEAIDLDDEEEAATEEDTPKAAKAEKPKKVKGLGVPDFDRFRLRLILGALAVILVIIFLILATTVMPRATIAIQTTSSPISASFNLTASTDTKSLDTKKGVIPAVLKTSALSTHQQVKASGQQNNGDKATGSVTMSTCVAGSSPQDIPAGTGVSSNGLAYITQQTAHFNPTFQICGNGTGVLAQSNSVNITAQQGGSNYNTSISGATIAGYSGVTADGSASGGTDNIITVLSQQDIDSVKDKLSDDDKTKFVQDFEKQLGSDASSYVLTNTLKSSDPVVSASAKAGDQVSSADVTIKITYTVLVLNKEDLSKAITEHLEAQIDKNKQQIGTDDVTKDATINIQSQTKPNVADLQIVEQTVAIPKIDTDTIKKQVGGQKVGDIRSLIEQWPGVKNVDVKLSPFWVSKAPKNTGKIKIVLTQEKASNNPNNSNNSGT